MASRHQCANCGRDVRKIPDSERRFEGGKWYCSQSCFLTAESSASRSSVRKASKPRRGKWRRRIGWTVGIIVALIVGLSVLGAFVGTSDGTKTPKKSNAARLLPKHPRLGTRVRPIPFGAAFTVPGSGYAASKRPWRVKVTRFLRNANAAVAGVKVYGQLQNQPPAKGSQYVLVSFALKYVGGGSAPARDVTNQLALIGKHGVPYTALDNSCAAPREINEDKPVYSGQGTSGDVCFVIASNDAATLRLYIGSSFSSKPAPGDVWFALRT